MSRNLAGSVISRVRLALAGGRLEGLSEREVVAKVAERDERGAFVVATSAVLAQLRESNALAADRAADHDAARATFRAHVVEMNRRLVDEGKAPAWDDGAEAWTMSKPCKAYLDKWPATRTWPRPEVLARVLEDRYRVEGEPPALKALRKELQALGEVAWKAKQDAADALAWFRKGPLTGEREAQLREVQAGEARAFADLEAMRRRFWAEYGVQLPHADQLLVPEGDRVLTFRPRAS